VFSLGNHMELTDSIKDIYIRHMLTSSDYNNDTTYLHGTITLWVNSSCRLCNDSTHMYMAHQFILERCNPWPHVTNHHISISQLLSLWCHSHYDVSRLRHTALVAPAVPILIMTSYHSRRSHYDIILIVTSFATELATPTVTDIRTPYRI